MEEANKNTLAGAAMEKTQKLKDGPTDRQSDGLKDKLTDKPKSGL